MKSRLLFVAVIAVGSVAQAGNGVLNNADRETRNVHADGTKVALVANAGGVSLTAAATTFDANVTPDVIFGSGNSNGGFTVDRANGVELGLRAKIPFVGTRNSNGDGTYSYSIAEQEAAPDSGSCPAVGGCWNFEWTINTDYLGSSGVKIGDLTYMLQLDFDPSQATDFLVADPVTPGVPPLFAPFFDHSIGNNTTANGAGVEAVDASTYASLIASNNVLQQSWRHAFFPIHPTLTYDPTVDGTYDVVLTAFNSSGSVVASTSIQVIIGAGRASAGAIPTVSEWGLVVLGVFLLVLAKVCFRRRREASA